MCLDVCVVHRLHSSSDLLTILGLLSPIVLR